MSSRIFRSGLCCCWAILAAVQLWAQDSPAPPEPGKPLTLRQCLDIALANQTDVLVGERNLIAAGARQTQAGSSYYPQVSLQVTEDIVTSDSGSGGGRDGTTISLSQNIYDGGLREARISSARYATAQSEATLTRTRHTVMYDVTRAYTALLRSQRQAEVAERRVAYIEGQRNLIQARIHAGDAAEVDALPIEAQLANARVDQLSANNAIRTTAIQLQLAMGLTPTSSLAVQDIDVPSTLKIPPVEDCLTEALAQRPEVAQNRAAVGVAQASVRTARINQGLRPVITGHVSQPIGDGDDLTYSLNAGLAFDLFDGGNNKAAYQEAKIGLSTVELRAAQTTKEITADIQDAYLHVTNAWERRQASALSLKAAQRNFEAQQARYAQGLAIPLDLLNAQLEVTTAESNAVQAQYDYLTALAQLHYAMGREGGVTWEE